MADKQFGRTITEDAAHRIFERVMNIKQRSYPKLQEALKDDPEALRYYCGRQGHDPLSEDWAFVFNKDFLHSLLDRSDALNADCFFVFYGAKGVADMEPTTPGGEPDEDERPTLMLFPAQYHEVESAGETEFTLFLKDGGQYPGTGGDTLPYGAPVRIPSTFSKGKYRL